jgi:hypothetical protein
MTVAEFVAHIFHNQPDWDDTVWAGETAEEHDWRQRKNALKPLDASLVSQLLAEMFEDSGRLLAPYTTNQVARGLHFCLEHSRLAGRAIWDSNVPEPARLRALRSFVPLFQQVMAERCLPARSQGQAEYNPLNGVCYMWWDGLYATPDDAEHLIYDAAALQVMAAILAIPHLACQESALHGLGHWQMYYRVPVVHIINKFLKETPDLPRSLVRYAHNARRGSVL